MSLAGSHILNIAADLERRRARSRLLGGFGAHLIDAPTTCDAVCELRDRAIDLVLLDPPTDDADGKKALTLLRSVATTAAAPVVLFVPREADPWIAAAPDGATAYLTTTSAPVELLSVIHMLFRTRQVEDRFRHAQKMEPIGRLASSVAHDFNNLLTVILGFAEAAVADTDPASPLYEDLREIERAARMGAGVCKPLLGFTRKQTASLRYIELSEAVDNAARLLQPLLGEHIHLVVETPTHAWVKADPVELHQVVMNLCVNARDAMPDGGTLRLEVAPATAATAGATGEFVRLSVIDSGVGMDEETRSRLFEPFFTTKMKGKGTGLGTATVYEIVKRSAGRIEVQSAPGAGTAFHIYLPCAAPHEATAASESAGPTRTVLLVDDEEPIRTIARRILVQHGFRVIEAMDGEDALARAREHAPSIDLLVTDVVMPGLSGPHLARQLGPRFPGMRVLFISGYTGYLDPDDLSEGGGRFLRKPFSAADLIAQLRALSTPPAEDCMLGDRTTPADQG